MNKPYGDRRHLMLHSRHMSQRQTPPFTNFAKRQQSAYKATRNSNEGGLTSMYSTGFFPKRESGTVLMTSTNWNKPKVFEAWKEDGSTKEQTEIMKATRKLKSSFCPRRSLDTFQVRRNTFEKAQKAQEQSFRKLCNQLGITSDFLG